MQCTLYVKILTLKITPITYADFSSTDSMCLTKVQGTIASCVAL